MEEFSFRGRTYAYPGNRKWIDTIYTNVITDMVKDGYLICTPTAGGSGGEIAKVDLVKDDRLVRVRLDTFSEKDLEGLELSISRWNYAKYGHKGRPMRYCYSTFNTHSSEYVVEDSVRFYNIETQGFKARWWGSEKMARDAKELHWKRVANRQFKEPLDWWRPLPEHEAAAIQIILRLLHKVGYEKAKAENITALYRCRVKLPSNKRASAWSCEISGRHYEFHGNGFHASGYWFEKYPGGNHYAKIGGQYGNCV